jgi:Na+/proline symporter
MDAPTLAGSVRGLDVAIVVVYLAGVLLVGGVTGWRRRAKRRGDVAPPTVDEARSFFLAESGVPWWAVALSFFASNIGTDAIVGLASAGATVGFAAAFF